ncbi:MAG: LysR family transcriptional regulator [Eubacteriales bacterium]
MTLRHLKILVTVCETGSATAAGKKLNIAQPSISLAISELESYYGIMLFDRIAKRLHITEAGKHFLQYATHIVGSFEDMEKEVKNFDSIGIIRIGASITIGNYLVIKYIKAFKETHPNMAVQTIIDNSETIEQHILNNHIDIGLIEGIVHSEYIQSKHLMDDELVLICSLTHPFANGCAIDVEMLKDEVFVLREKGSAGREIFDGIMASMGIEVVPICESISTQAIVRAVNAGLGLSVLPYLLVKDSLERQEITTVKIKNVSLKRKFRIIYHKNKYITQSAKDFISLCQNQNAYCTGFKISSNH